MCAAKHLAALPWPAEREARWRLFVRFAAAAASEDEARAVLGQALAGLEPLWSPRGAPVVRPRHRHTPDGIWIAEVQPDLTHLQVIEPHDAKTRCSFVAGHFPGDVTWAVPQNTEREARREWPTDIWQGQPGRDDVLLHLAVRAVMSVPRQIPPARIYVGPPRNGRIRGAASWWQGRKLM